MAPQRTPSAPTASWTVTYRDGSTERVRALLEREKLVLVFDTRGEVARALPHDLLLYGTLRDIDSVVAVTLRSYDEAITGVRRELTGALLPLHPTDPSGCPIIADCAAVQRGGEVVLVDAREPRQHGFLACRCAKRICHLDGATLKPLMYHSILPSRDWSGRPGDATLLEQVGGVRIVQGDALTERLQDFGGSASGTRRFFPGQEALEQHLTPEGAGAANAAQEPWNSWHVLHGVADAVPPMEVRTEEPLQRMGAPDERAAAKRIDEQLARDLQVQLERRRVERGLGAHGAPDATSGAPCARPAPRAHQPPPSVCPAPAPEQHVRRTPPARPAASPATKAAGRPAPLQRPPQRTRPAAPARPRSPEDVPPRLAGRRAVAASLDEAERALFREYVAIAATALGLELHAPPTPEELPAFLREHGPRAYDVLTQRGNDARRAVEDLNTLIHRVSCQPPRGELGEPRRRYLQVGATTYEQRELELLRSPANALFAAWDTFLVTNRSTLVQAV